MTPSNFLKNFRNFLAGPTKRTQPCEAYNYASLLVLTTCWCLQHVPNGRHSKSFKWNTAGPFTPHTQTQMHGARRSAATSGVCLIRSGAAGFPKKLHSKKITPPPPTWVCAAVSEANERSRRFPHATPADSHRPAAASLIDRLALRYHARMGHRYRCRRL
jgi:hypothetical protein